MMTAVPEERRHPDERPGPGRPAGPAVDRPPPEVVAAARAAFAQRRRQPVASLVYDSLVDEQHATPEDHRLAFEHPVFRIDVEVSYQDRFTLIAGRVSGAVVDRVVLHFRDDTLALVKGVEEGRFRFDPVGHGVVRLSLEAARAVVGRSDWFRI